MNIENVLGNALTVVGLAQALLVLLKRKENMIIQLLFGIILVVFSFYVKLYADIIESIITVIIAIFGMYVWYKKELAIHHTTKNEFLLSLIVFISSSVFLFLILRNTDDVFPLMDSLTTGMSLTAGWLMARKSLQAWTVWFIYDVSTCWLYFNIDQIGPTILSFIWIFMAVGTYITWYKDIKNA